MQMSSVIHCTPDDVSYVDYVKNVISVSETTEGYPT